ncbi:hypothetical protein [Amnibacterium kyonggiense]|uniref:Uncharacterized protein n=1 Tax=Amnibacterium kyonggiense TaxID=595671 RepID=A0A4V3EAS3_9MICO|nr:hypothetical protein [Amnibacterium kyonggiense]TDS77574.1 hypothetical protein CLV52_2531 [Amnibacterium kyonggiense]
MIALGADPGATARTPPEHHALHPRDPLMRIAAFIVALVVTNLVVTGGILLIVVSSPEPLMPLIWLPTSALMLLVYPPLLAGMLLSCWDVRSSEEAAVYFRRWWIGLGSAQALGAVAVLTFSVLAGTAWWLTPAYLVVAVLLDLLVVRVGRALRLREEATRPRQVPWTPMSRQEIVRRIVVIAGVFVLVLLVAGIGLSLLTTAVGAPRERTDVPALLFAVEFAFLAAALTCTATALRLQRQVREQVTRDVGMLRRIAKVVARGKRIDLAPDEEVLAARYAAIIAVSLPFTLGFTVLLYAALAAQQAEQILSGRLGWFPVGFLVFLVVALVALTPLQIVRIRRVRAYARTHAALLHEVP